MGKVVIRYRPAYRKQNLRRESKNKAMDAFLMSNRVQRVADEAADDIVSSAQARARAAGLVKSGKYVTSFRSAPTKPIVIEGNARRAARVWNTARQAAILELGPKKDTGRAYRILTKAGFELHTPKGIA